MVLFIASILSFLWRTGSMLDPEERPRLGAHASLGPRIAVTAVFALGMVYFAMIVKTLKSYGTHVGPGMGGRMGRGTGELRASNSRAREIEVAMARRGRERERSVSGPRRREEVPERERRGLGLTGLSPRSLDSGVGLGLENAEEKRETSR
jgi:hypothetical protein